MIDRTSKELLDLPLHNFLDIGGQDALRVYRVPGGWIYLVAIENGTGGFDVSTCFVPMIEVSGAPISDEKGQ